MAKILLIDDEPGILTILSTLLKAEGHDVVATGGGDESKEAIETQDFDLMLSDLRMTPLSGIDLLKMAREKQPNLTVIMLTAYGSVSTAGEAMKLGAFDYITKPFKINELLSTVQRALEHAQGGEVDEDEGLQIEAPYRFMNLIAESPAMRSMCELIRKVGPTDAAVLITGEKGTGKSLVAEAIHASSRRKDKEFRTVDCAAHAAEALESEIFGYVSGAVAGATSDKEGLFEAAAEGTVFLESVESMPASIQIKLLEALRQKKIGRIGADTDVDMDVRILASANLDLKVLIGEGAFNQELHNRLSVIPVEIKPLRERREDILPLAHSLAGKEAVEGGAASTMDKEAHGILLSYRWPGNVTELHDAMTYAVKKADGGTITKAALPPRIAATPVTVVAGPSAGAARGKALKEFLQAKQQEAKETG